LCAACEELNDWRVVVSLFQFVARGLPRKSPVVSAPANYTAPIVQLQYRRRDLSPGSETRQRSIAPDGCCPGQLRPTAWRLHTPDRQFPSSEPARSAIRVRPTAAVRDSGSPIPKRPSSSTKTSAELPASADPDDAGAVRIGERRPIKRTRLLARGCARPAPQSRRSRARRAARCGDRGRGATTERFALAASRR